MKRYRARYETPYGSTPTRGTAVLDSAPTHQRTKRSQRAWGRRGNHLPTPPRIDAVISLAIFALSLAVGSYQAFANSVWLDEAYAVSLSQLRWSTLWRYLWGIEAHMGFYYVALRGWIWLLSVGGVAPTEFAVRLPSLVCVALSAVIVYQLGRRFLGDITGVMGALLFLMNFLVLVQGNEARQYGLQLLFVCASWYALVAALAHGASRWRWWAVYAALVTLQLYAEVFSLVIVGAQLATVVCLLALGPRWRARVWRSADAMALSIACALLLAAPVLYDALLHGSGTGWIPPARLSDFAALFNPLGGGVEPFAPLLLAIGLLELSIVALARAPLTGRWADASARLTTLLGGRAPALFSDGHRGGKGRDSAAPDVPLVVVALVCWLAFPILLAFFLTQPGLNLHLFNYAFFAICAPAYCLLAGLCVARVRWRYAQVILVVVLIAFSLRVVPTARDSANYDA
ncbi:MAG TPA: glycosyltransferase family 39 protein, partial [Ktedonobacterales bacterium]|nr:glycosyltransferase family 39 protein [Ktedonobacterales bacterium]